MAMKYTAEFKREAVRMMTELGLGVTEVSKKCTRPVVVRVAGYGYGCCLAQWLGRSGLGLAGLVDIL